MNLGINFHAELARLSNASDENEYEAALRDAATRIQESVLNSTGNNIELLLADVPQRQLPMLDQVLQRAISIRPLADGSVLRLWTLPAVLQVKLSARKIIEVPADGLPLIRLTSALHANLQMTDTGGWINVFPVLLSDEYRLALPLGQLIETPVRTRQCLMGRGTMPVFQADNDSPPIVGMELLTYSALFVSYQPPGVKIGMGASSPELTRRLTAWLSSLPDGRNGDLAVRWVGPPRPFSRTIEDGYASWPFGPAAHLAPGS